MPTHTSTLMHTYLITHAHTHVRKHTHIYKYTHSCTHNTKIYLYTTHTRTQINTNTHSHIITHTSINREGKREKDSRRGVWGGGRRRRQDADHARGCRWWLEEAVEEMSRSMIDPRGLRLRRRWRCCSDGGNLAWLWRSYCRRRTWCSGDETRGCGALWEREEA